MAGEWWGWGASLVKHPPANAETWGSIPIQAMEQLSPGTTTAELVFQSWGTQLLDPHALEPVLCKRKAWQWEAHTLS